MGNGMDQQQLAPTQGILAKKLFWWPLLAQKSTLAVVGLALIMLSWSQAMFIILVGPFMKALFGEGAGRDFITGQDILPAGFVTVFPDLATLVIPVQDIAWMVPAAMFVTGFIKGLSTWIYQLNQQKIALRVATHYRIELFKSLLTLPWIDIVKQSAGYWMSLIMNDVMYLQQRFTEIVGSVVRDLVVILGALIAIGFMHWPTALVLVCIGPLLALLLGRSAKKISHYAEFWQRELGRIAALVLDLRSRFSLILAQDGQKKEKKRFDALNEDYYAMMRKSLFVRATFGPTIEWFGIAMFAATIFALSRRWFGEGFGPAELLQFFAALGVMIRPLRNLGEQIGRFQETKGVLKQSIETFNLAAAKSGLHPHLIEGEVFNGNCHIRNLKASYGDKNECESQNIDIVGGRAIAVVGPSGAGKSTLVRTIAGIIQPDVWESKTSWQSLGESVSFVSQLPFLFHDTLRNNLIYGIESPPVDGQIYDVLETLQLKDLVTNLEKGLDTKVGVIKSNFSGGQLQRFVVARALLRGAKIWLMDEATSAVDVKLEKHVTSSLIESAQIQNKALLMTTHRLSCLNLFDEVWFMEEGTIKLVGPHSTLMDEPRYRAFIAQSGEG
ncbi:MAG: hypothetical protein CMP10_19320 [Zetaproteobacteria bacterium]|nr:hypothetical protein [Pseudobdellovibrionaceae bacterium]